MSPVDTLRDVLPRYMAAIEGDWHRQSRAFHQAVARDAAWSLWRATGLGEMPNEPAVRRRTPAEALCEVCRETVILCLDTCKRPASRLQAFRNAAELLGLDYDELKALLP